MPFFISVSVDGTLIGRSQILNVPVAEVANKLKSSFTKEDLVGTWVSKDYYGDTHIYTFNPDGTAIFIYNTSAPYKRQGEYIIEGDNIHVFLLDTWDTGHVEWSHHIGRFYKSKLIFDSGEFTKQ